MSWMRLLAVGRSIGPVGDGPCRYRMTDGLPMLGRAKLATHRAAAAKTPPLVREKALEGAERMKSTSQRKATQVPATAGRKWVMFGVFKKILFGKDPKMKMCEAGAPGAAPAMLDVPAQAYPLGRWTMFKNPFVRRTPRPETVVPVQGELLLDLVKPMRNDLQDADLELVPAVRRAAQSGGPGPAPASASGDPEPAVAARSVSTPGRPAWGRVADQYFGAEKP